MLSDQMPNNVSMSATRYVSKDESEGAAGTDH
jgi:hypothetical protein